MNRFPLAVVPLAVLAIGCATSPLGRSQLVMVSDAEMEQMGLSAFQQIVEKQPQTDDPRVAQYVVCVAQAIVGALPSRAEAQRSGYALPEGEWEVRVFADDTANAFALPGGKIGVNTGLLAVAKDQSQLATVIGHEVAHVLARHSAERVSAQLVEASVASAGAAIADPNNRLHGTMLAALGIGVQLGGLSYSRSHEREADLLGLDLMARAGFDPAESVALWQNMAAANHEQPPEWLSTHPATESRIEELRKRIPYARTLRGGAREPSCRPPRR